MTIFTPPEEGYEFGSFRDTAHFQETVAERYERVYGNIEVAAAEAVGKVTDTGNGKGTGKGKGKDVGKRDGGGLGRQVWHTPTELFKVSVAALFCPIIY